MLEIERKSSFEKDVKNLNKKHYDFSKLSEVLNLLIKKEIIPGRYKDHSLNGNLKGLRECYIENNIIMIYQIIDNSLILFRIGTHKDLLGK